MMTVRRSDDRGHLNHGWLDTYHTFSFGRYHDPAWTRFRTLRVINDDIVDPGEGFGTHPHKDMEIFTYVVEGAIRHRDSMGHESVMPAGGIQRMTAGSGVTHSEFNASATDPLRLLQIWFLPREQGMTPSYQEGRVDDDARRNVLRPILVGDTMVVPGANEALTLYQDAVVYASMPGDGVTLEHALAADRHAWLQVVDGTVEVGGETLSRGDGLAVSDEPALAITGRSDNAHFLLFDLG